jgi:hypothetical protein
VALSALAVALAVAATRRTGRARVGFAVASGAALAVGILIKLFVVVALVPVALYLAAPIFPLRLGADGRPRLPAWEALRARLRTVAPDLGWLAVGLFGAALLVLLPLLPSWGDLYGQVVSYHFAAAHTSSAGLRAQAHEVARGLGWFPLALPALLAVGLLAWQRMWSLLPPLLWALASLLLLLGQQPLFAHHVVLLSAPLALSGGLGLALGARELRAGRVRLPEWGEVPLVRAAALVLLVGAVAFGLGRSLDQLSAASAYVPLDQLRMALSLEASTPYGEVVITDDPYVAALADRAVPPELVDTSAVRIASGYLTSSELEEIITRTDTRTILFASGRFDQVPGFREWVSAHFQQIATFDGHQALYAKVPQRSAPV